QFQSRTFRSGRHAEETPLSAASVAHVTPAWREARWSCLSFALWHGAFREACQPCVAVTPRLVGRGEARWTWREACQPRVFTVDVGRGLLASPITVTAGDAASDSQSSRFPRR